MADWDVDLDDAIIEDTYHWVCPQCHAMNEAVAGNDDELVCWRCEVRYEYDGPEQERLMETFDLGEGDG
jgi:hypothetical protein